MRKLLLFLFFVPVALFGQATHSATLTWTDTVNPSGTLYDVYRLTGTCPTTAPTTTSGFTLLNSSPLSAKTYQDTTVAASTTYCYVVTALASGGTQSAPSPDAQAVIPSAFPPSVLSVSVD